MAQQNYGGLCCFGADRLTRIYTGIISSTAIASQFHTWNKPKGVRNIFLTVLGGGGGGGGGVAGNTTAARSGGGGGGAGALTRVIIPAALVPDILYVNPGYGGTGGAAQVNGVAGGASYVLLHPDTAVTAQNRLAYSSGGTNGLTAGGGGAGGTASANSTSPGMFFGIFISLTGGSGGAGATGNATAVAGVAVGATNHPMSSGGGGGGGRAITTGSGGNGATITTGGQAWRLVTGGTGGGTTTNGGTGADGIGYGENLINNYESISSYLPMKSTGGAGGGGAPDSFVGGIGGRGGFGSGGGGGGAGNTASAGAGGGGGPGIIIISCEF